MFFLFKAISFFSNENNIRVSKMGIHKISCTFAYKLFNF